MAEGVGLSLFFSSFSGVAEVPALSECSAKSLPLLSEVAEVFEDLESESEGCWG